LAVGCAALLGALWVTWLALDATRARTHLDEAAALVMSLQGEVASGDREAATAKLADLQAHSGEAFRATRGPHWWLASLVPGAGPNVRAVQVVADVVDDLATDALPGLLEVTEIVDPTSLAPSNGRFDLAPLTAAAPAVVAADAEVQRAAARVAGIDEGGLWPLIARPVADLHARLRSVAATTATASRAVQLLPPMLGADGSREYLLLVQNNAEPRASGGMPGAVVLLRAVDGAVQVVEQRTAGGVLSGLPAPALPLTPAERSLFGEGLGVYMANVTFTPDFPRTGELARAIWQHGFGGDVDGVISIDPGAMALLLEATGTVPLPPGPMTTAAGGALTSDNAVDLLLNVVYREVEDLAAQDAFFATTGAAVFGAVLGGGGEPEAVVDALTEATRQGRLKVWSAREEEQALISGTALSGELDGVQGLSPVVGVYLNDGTGSKIGYYLRADVTATTTTCHPDGSQTLAVDVSLTSAAPPDVADLPFYISGGSVLPPGEMRMNLLLYAPEGGVVEDVELADDVPGVFSAAHDGLAVVGSTVELSPGETARLRYTVRSGAGQVGAPVLRVTPLASEHTLTVQHAACS
jgi:hypothetical protein